MQDANEWFTTSKGLRLLRVAVAGVAVAIVLAVGAGTALAAGTKRLSYHDGPVLTHPSTTTLVYWHGQNGGLPTGYLGTLGQFINDWSGSSAHGVLTEYFQDRRARKYVANSVGLGGIVTDDNPIPRKPLTHGDLAREVRSFVQADHLPGGYAVNYALVLPIGVQTSVPGACAWHGWVAVGGVKVFYAVVPYYARSADCPMPGGPYPHGEATDNAVDRLSHELAEIATDPWDTEIAPRCSVRASTAWFLTIRKRSCKNGGDITQEIGDLCRDNGHGVYGPRDPLSGGDVFLRGNAYLIQGEWSNNLQRCSLGADGVRRCGSVGSSAGSGYGDIRAHGMTCNAVRQLLNTWTPDNPQGFTLTHYPSFDRFSDGGIWVTGRPLGD